jgi:LAO/AO transport system kinase
MPVNHTEAVLNGERLAISRALTQIENNTEIGLQLLESLFPHTGKAHLVGVTGAPGTGKSTLVNQLALAYRKLSDPPTVAIIAVDPTSPFSGGAILGDRIRMQDLAGDDGIFIRSMASRGSLGGLAAATAGLVIAFDAAGYEIIIIETVGAGQAEVDIARLAHSTIVIEAPGLGDEIQNIKAGILEIADILAVNKSDKPGAENTLRSLRNMLSLSRTNHGLEEHHGQRIAVEDWQEPPKNGDWDIPILPTVATKGEGVADLIESLDRHLDYLKISGEWQKRESARLSDQVETLLAAELRSRWEAQISQTAYHEVLAQVISRELNPWQAVKKLTKGVQK